MAIAADPANLPIVWWREPTKDQWFSWIAACLGWVLDAFDYTIFLFIMVPIAQEFGVSVTAVATVLTFTIWLRLVGAVTFGWIGDRIGRKAPLMLSILWYSACNFIAGFSPTFNFLFVVRALLGVGMGAEWSTGATLAMESWPARSRGFMGGVLQASWNLGFALASLAYWLLFDLIGWRGLLWLGILPALACVYIRFYVKEPAVWIENRKKQREQKQEVRAPLLAIFKPPLLAGTLIAWWWVAGTLVTYYSVFYLFPTWMQSDFKLATAAIATPTMLANLVGLASVSFAWIADHIGRRPAIIMQAMIGCLVAPAYLLTSDLNWIIVGFIIQGIFGGALPLMTPAYLTERFPTGVRTTATGLCYQGGAVAASFIPPVISYFAVERHMGFALPMLIGIWLGSASVIIAVLMSPETKGKVFVPELMKA
jgi:SHS family lactate transporter-like MFS transporter